MATEEEIRRSITDAGTQAAVAALEKQVEQSRSAYGAMDRDADAAAAAGAGYIRSSMQDAGLDRPMTGTAALTMETAAGDARNSNDRLQQLGEQGMRANIRYIQNSGQERAEELERQKATQKAETLAKYGDFSGYGALGYTQEEVQSMKNAWDAQNSKPEEYGGLGSYARTLLELYENNAGFDIGQNLQQALENGLITQRDYQAALIAARGIVAGSGAKKTKESTDGTDDTEKEPEEKPLTELEQAAQDAMQRTRQLDDGRYLVQNREDWEALKAYYDSVGMDMTRYFVMEGVDPSQRQDEGGVYISRIGYTTWSQLLKLVNSGRVIEEQDPATGQYTYRLNEDVPERSTPLFQMAGLDPETRNKAWQDARSEAR